MQQDSDCTHPEQCALDPSNVFDRALETYLNGLPQDKRQRQFLELCRRGSSDITPFAINSLIQQEQAKRTLTGPVKRLFFRLTNALKDYSEVMGQFGTLL